MASRSSLTACRSLLSRAVAASPSTLRASSSSLARSAIAVGSIRAISRSLPTFAAVEGDSEFSSTIAEELKFEKENSEDPAAAETDSFLKKAGWAVEDKAGSDVVTFTKKMDNETIAVTFRISDISESELPEEDEDAPEERDEDDVPEASAPQVTITVTKPTSAQGSLVFTTYIEEGTFSIENVSLFDEIVDATKETAEGQFRQDAAYGGPTFDNLDPAIQDHFESFLESRGINGELAEIVQEYQISKEQKEYVSWLANVKAFIDL